MNAMLRWSPTRRFHFHDTNELFNRSIGDLPTATEESTYGTAWLPAAEGRIEDGVYVMQISLPGVDAKDVKVSLMCNVLTVKGERKADHDSTGKDYFVREIAYGTFERRFELPEGVDAAQVQAKQANGMLEVRVPSPLAAVPRLIEIKAA
jgi:HSP20 family protein